MGLFTKIKNKLDFTRQDEARRGKAKEGLKQTKKLGPWQDQEQRMDNKQAMNQQPRETTPGQENKAEHNQGQDRQRGTGESH